MDSPTPRCLQGTDKASKVSKPPYGCSKTMTFRARRSWVESSGSSGIILSVIATGSGFISTVSLESSVREQIWGGQDQVGQVSPKTLPRPSSYPLLGPKYPLLGTIYPQLRVQGGSWYLLVEIWVDSISAEGSEMQNNPDMVFFSGNEGPCFGSP